jgi:hypothetical protein
MYTHVWTCNKKTAVIRSRTNIWRTRPCSSSPARVSGSGGGGQRSRPWIEALGTSRLTALAAARGRRQAGLKAVEIAGGGATGGRHGAVSPRVSIRWPPFATRIHLGRGAVKKTSRASMNFFVNFVHSGSWMQARAD